MPRRKQATDTPVVRRPPATTPRRKRGPAGSARYRSRREATASRNRYLRRSSHDPQNGSETEKLQRAKLGLEAELLKVKRENYEAQTQSAEIYEQALKAFRSYQGVDEDEGL